MKLDRNTNSNQRGKYALLNLRTNKIEWGEAGSDEEFFVIKLKDINAEAGLLGYADKANETDMEWGQEILELSKRAGPNHPLCKIPD